MKTRTVASVIRSVDAELARARSAWQQRFVGPDCTPEEFQSDVWPWLRVEMFAETTRLATETLQAFLATGNVSLSDN